VVPVACKVCMNVDIKGGPFQFLDHAFVLGAFEVSAWPLDCIRMGLLGICRKAGTLVHGIGDVRLGALFKVVELPNDVPVVKALVMQGCIVMVTK